MYNNYIVNPKVEIPYTPSWCEPVWHIYAMQCSERDSLEQHLINRGIGVNKHYPIPIHLQKCYKDLGIQAGELPIAEMISKTELSIPMYYGLSIEDARYVIDAINDF